MPHKLRCSLLCEDLEQERLFRPILERKFDRVRVEPRKPNGGFTFVLANLARLILYFQQRPDEAVGLLVVIDGDEAGFNGRSEELNRVIRQAGLADRSLGRMAVCIPSRNVETWDLWLIGARDLDEQTNYKPRWQRERVSRTDLVEAWFAPLSEEQRQEEIAILPALARGREEVKRLERFSRD